MHVAARAETLKTSDASLGEVVESKSIQELPLNGNRPNANYFLVDGVSNTDPTFNTQSLSLSPDAVREFQVQTRSYAAEMGGAGGGQINIATRSGTSHFHGRCWERTRSALTIQGNQSLDRVRIH